MSRRFAADTSVAVERSTSEIGNLLRRYGATEFFSGWDQNEAKLGFAMNGTRMIIKFNLPAQDDPRFGKTERGRDRRGNAAREAWGTGNRRGGRGGAPGA